MIRVLRNPVVLAVSVGHLACDILSNGLPVLLVVYAARMGLSNGELGTVAMLYALAGSLTQPLFGLVADRWKTPLVGAAGLVWQAGGFALAALLPGYAALAGFVLAGFGSAAYHPQGAMHARRAAGADAASGTSIFFFFGMAGQSLGPLLAGLLLVRVPVSATVVLLSLLAVPGTLLLLRQRAVVEEPETGATQSAAPAAHRIAWAPLSLLAFMLVLFFSGWPIAATSTFLPKWMADAGVSPGALGAVLSMFMIASAFGNVFGGWLADRWSRKGVVVLALALAPLPFYALYAAPSTGAVTIIAAALAGFIIRMPHSVLVLLGQNLFPGRMGFASGLVLGFFFAVSAVAGWLTGLLGDALGLHQALLLLPWICGAALLCSLLLPRTRARQPAVTLAAGKGSR